MSKNWYDRHLVILGKTIKLYGRCLYARLAIIINQKLFPSVPSNHFLFNGFSVAALVWEMVALRYCISYGKMVGYAIYGDRRNTLVEEPIYILAHAYVKGRGHF